MFYLELLMYFLHAWESNLLSPVCAKFLDRKHKTLYIPIYAIGIYLGKQITEK